MKTWTDNITSGVAIDSGRLPSTQYYYRVGAYNGDQIKTATTETLPVSTKGGVQPATNLTGEAFTNSIIWRWSDNATDESGYALYDNGTLKATLGPDIIQTTEAGLSPCELHTPVMIRTIRGPDNSDSASTSEWTLPVAPSTPTELSRTGTTITFTLPKGSNVAPTFNIERQNGPTWTAIATEFAGTSYTDGSVVPLAPSTAYNYRVYAVNGNHRAAGPSPTFTTSTQGIGFETEPPTM